MPARQHTNPLVIHGITLADTGSYAFSPLLPISHSSDQSKFDEQWFQDFLFRYPSVLPASEIEPAFHNLEAVAKELQIGAGSADLLLANIEGNVAVVEPKLFRNHEAKREVVAQTIDYASQLSGWSYAELVQAIRKAKREESTSDGDREDPLLQVMQKSVQGSGFDHDEFRANVARNLRLGLILLLIVGDKITEGAERMVEFIHQTPHLHFTLGLIEMGLFRENDRDFDPIFVQPRIIAKTELHVRSVIDIRLPEGARMASTIPDQGKGTTKGTTITTITLEEVREKLGRVSSRRRACELGNNKSGRAPIAGGLGSAGAVAEVQG